MSSCNVADEPHMVPSHIMTEYKNICDRYGPRNERILTQGFLFLFAAFMSVRKEFEHVANAVCEEYNQDYNSTEGEAGDKDFLYRRFFVGYRLLMTSIMYELRQHKLPADKARDRYAPIVPVCPVSHNIDFNGRPESWPECNDCDHCRRFTELICVFKKLNNLYDMCVTYLYPAAH